MSNCFQAITKSDDGTCTLAVPVNIDTTLVPLIDIQSDTSYIINRYWHAPYSGAVGNLEAY